MKPPALNIPWMRRFFLTLAIAFALFALNQLIAGAQFFSC
jgi:hypothetical protein